MTIQPLPSTTNFSLAYDDSNTLSKGMAQAIAAICETEFQTLAGWFGITTGFGPSDRITMTVQSISAGGANNFGYQSGGNSKINVNFLPASFNATQANQIAPMMFVNELVEIFMDFNNKTSGATTWVAGHSDGEGLSQFLGILRFPAGHYLAYPSWTDSWLSSSRADFITINETTDGDQVSFGCVLLFLFYLNTQLGFSPAQIVQKGGATPAQTYQNLTGDPANPFGFFRYLLDTAFPGTSTITGGSGQAQDDPFPLFTLQFADNKNSFSKADVTNAVGNGLSFPDAFLLVLEGFSPTAWQARGASAPSDPAIRPPATFPGLRFRRTRVAFENAAIPLAPQRITFHYDVSFDASSPAAFTASVQADEVDSALSVAAQTANAATSIVFYGAEDPYFTSVSPAIDNVSWLAEDLRVFFAAAGGNPVPGGPAFASDSIAGARTYLQTLLAYLDQTYGDPSLVDPFDPASNVLPGQSGALTGDSSVIPNLLFNGGSAASIYNFAIARVRLDGAVGSATLPVRVFFRLWGTQTADTDYAPTTTYDAQNDSLGLPSFPLPDPDSSTFPFFATSNTPAPGSNTDPEFGAGGVNAKIITVRQSAGQWVYFGCLLNVYDPTYLVNGTSVTQLLPGTHHCLVAQIAYDDAPIVAAPGVTLAPGNTDKLAQRNLQVTPA